MLKKLLCFIACMTTAICVHGHTTYKLTRVTSVENGGMYVFEQSGRVMSNTIDGSHYLLTTASYKTKNITVADETYIWQLEKSGDYYKMKNLSKSSPSYLAQDKDSPINLVWDTKNNTWNFKFQENGTAIIESVLANNRYLSYQGNDILLYNRFRAYAYNNDGTLAPNNPGLITVYKLEEENSEDVVVTKVAGLATYVSDHDLNYSEVGGGKSISRTGDRQRHQLRQSA